MSLCNYCSKKGEIVESICKITVHNHYWNLCEEHLLSEGERLGISKDKIKKFITGSVSSPTKKDYKGKSPCGECGKMVGAEEHTFKDCLDWKKQIKTKPVVSLLEKIDGMKVVNPYFSRQKGWNLGLEKSKSFVVDCYKGLEKKKITKARIYCIKSKGGYSEAVDVDVVLLSDVKKIIGEKKC